LNTRLSISIFRSYLKRGYKRLGERVEGKGGGMQGMMGGAIFVGILIAVNCQLEQRKIHDVPI
jgi:hypothetical protein